MDLIWEGLNPDDVKASCNIAGSADFAVTLRRLFG